MAGAIPTFCGKQFATSAQVSSFSGVSTPSVKIIPRNYGIIFRPTGVCRKQISLNCNIIGAGTNTRQDLEDAMHSLNETFGMLTGTLVVDDNSYLNCALGDVSYDDKIVNNYAVYNANFTIGNQVEDSDIDLLSMSNLGTFSRGRSATFTYLDINEEEKVAPIEQNIDLFRNFQNQIFVIPYNLETNDELVKVHGGFEQIKAVCWAVNANLDQATGFKQSAMAYLFNLALTAVGRVGNLSINGNEIENCFLSGVKLVKLDVSSLRYDLEFIVSLQC